MREVFDAEGVEHRPVVSGNLLKQPFLKGYSLDTKKKIANIDIVHDQGVYIGNNHFVTIEDMKFLQDVVGKINEQH